MKQEDIVVVRSQSRRGIARRALTLSSAGLVGVLLFSACTPASDTSEPETPAAVAPPSINAAGTLSVCSALGLGAIPLFYFDEDQEPSGIEMDMAREVAAELGLEFNAVSTAFPSLIPSLDAKNCDVVMGSLFINPEREEVVDFVPYLHSGSVLYTLTENSASVTGLDESVCGLRVGTTTGSSAAVAIKEQDTACAAAGQPNMLITELDSAANGRQMILNDQLDVMSGSSADIYYMVAESDGEIAIQGEPFQSFTIGAAVRKGNTELAEAIQTAFDKMVESGRYAEILEEQGLAAIAYEF